MEQSASVILERLTHRRTAAAVIALLAVHIGLIAYSATRHSPTLNEPGHLVAGLSHWGFGRFEVYCVNPPLVHYMAAIPVLIAGYEADWSGLYDSPGARPEFKMGEDFIRANGERSIWLFTIARWACLPFSVIGGLFCFAWSRELWRSNLAGIISLILWCFEPNILAHGELITPDCAATALGLGATYLFWRWLRQPTWGRTTTAGLVLGLAELTKTSWIILFGLYPAIWIVDRWLVRRSETGSQRPAASSDLRAESREKAAAAPLSQVVALLALGLYVLNLGYGFDDSFTKLRDFTFVSHALTGLKPGEPGNRFGNSWVGALPVPVPKQYLRGIDLQKKDFEDYGQPSYLRGEWKDGGWWYYYIYGLAVKTPHGSQATLVIAIFTLFYFRRYPSFRLLPREEPGANGTPLPGSLAGREASEDSATLNPELSSLPPRPSAIDLIILMAPPLVLLVMVSSQLEFNHHLRYVLPVLGFVFIFSGVTARWFDPSLAQPGEHP